MAAVAAASAIPLSAPGPRRAPCLLFTRSLCPSAAAAASYLPTRSISSQLSLSGPFTHWSGLKCLTLTLPNHRKSKERTEKRSGKGVYASLFGVGAPEVLVIGVVALLVFGPKGLAEVARTLGKTLRAFQPTIKELQDVSKEFKSTLEREIGLDEIASSTNYINKSALYADENQQAAIDPNGKPSSDESYTSEELLKVTEAQLAASVTSSEMKDPKPETAATSAADGPTSEKPLQASTKGQSMESAPKNEAQVPSSDTTENQR